MGVETKLYMHGCSLTSSRSLGVEHSFVLSVSLDNWTHSQVDHMAENGNHKVNALLEHNVPKTIEVPCLSYTDRDTREKYIHAKYVHQLFKQVGNRNPRAPERVVRKPSPSRSPPNTRKAHSAMVEYIGIVTVLIEECRDLVIKDLLSSDPYCVLTIGSQSSKTTTKYKCLDPKYNETFNFSWDGVDPLVVQVFDKDELTKDDHMGLVELDLAPLLRKEGMVLEGWFPVRHRKKDKQQGEMRLEITFTQIK